MLRLLRARYYVRFSVQTIDGCTSFIQVMTPQFFTYQIRIRPDQFTRRSHLIVLEHFFYFILDPFIRHLPKCMVELRFSDFVFHDENFPNFLRIVFFISHVYPVYTVNCVQFRIFFS